MSYRYNRSPFTDFLTQGGDPATRTIVAANVLTFALAFFGLGGVMDALVFNPSRWLTQPWTLLTYPLVGAAGNPIGLLFLCYWMWVVGGSLERSWSTRIFIGFLAMIAATSALGIWIGYLLLGTAPALVGLGLPLSGLTVAWCYLNPNMVIQLYLVLPVKAKHLAWLTMALTFFFFGQSHPLLGFFALTGIGVAILWLRGLPWGDVMSPRSSYRKPPPRSPKRRSSSFNPFETFARWRRKRQFQRLWKNSGLPESEDDLELPPR